MVTVENQKVLKERDAIVAFITERVGKDATIELMEQPEKAALVAALAAACAEKAAPLKTAYKDHFYFNDKGAWTVESPDGSLFLVALDDSKTHGNRRHIEEANTPETCRKYIDWVTRK